LYGGDTERLQLAVSEIGHTGRALVLGGIACNTMVHLDSFPEPRPQIVFARSYHETVGSSGAGKALNLRAALEDGAARGATAVRSSDLAPS